MLTVVDRRGDVGPSPEARKPSIDPLTERALLRRPGPSLDRRKPSGGLGTCGVVEAAMMRWQAPNSLSLRNEN